MHHKVLNSRYRCYTVRLWFDPQHWVALFFSFCFNPCITVHGLPFIFADRGNSKYVAELSSFFFFKLVLRGRDTSKLFLKHYDLKSWTPPPLRVMTRVADSHTWT